MLSLSYSHAIDCHLCISLTFYCNIPDFFSMTHTHNPFYGPVDFIWDYPGVLVPEPIWILLKQETLSGSGISLAICKSAPRLRQITIPAVAPRHSVFNRLDALPANQPSVQALKAFLFHDSNKNSAIFTRTHLHYTHGVQYIKFKV